jgi:RNA polymerase sigma-70 factor (ECF subfamily)
MESERPIGELSKLLRDVARGDTGALTELYRQVEAPVHAYAASRLGRQEAAAEVLHEVMLEVWRRADTFRGDSRPLTWILGIARYKILDQRRRSDRWKPAPPPSRELPDPAAGPAERLESHARRDAVREALEHLSDGHREVIHLAFYQDLSYPEIACLLDIPPGTVKTRVFHAKKALRRRLTGFSAGGAR